MAQLIAAVIIELIISPLIGIALNRPDRKSPVYLIHGLINTLPGIINLTKTQL